MRPQRRFYNLFSDDFKHSFELNGIQKYFIIRSLSDVSRTTDILPVLKDTSAMLSSNRVFNLFQRENKKRYLAGIERAV